MNRAAAIILLVLLADQALKVWVKLTFTIGQHIPEHLDSWYYLHFIENEGMAFGMKFGGQMGKLMLTLFRIVAVLGIGWYLRRARSDLRQFTIATVTQEQLRTLDAEHIGKADVILCVDAAMPGSH